MAQLPPASRRLFGHYPVEGLEPQRDGVFVALRLAEEGDREDLGWLLSRLGEESFCRILERYGPRQLSRRSLSFWRLTLGVAAQSDSRAQEVWPR